MRVGLVDVDGHKFPNLPLMKLSAYHKSKGDTVEWWWTDMIHYDVVYMSKVFGSQYSKDVPEPINADRVIKGGTGYAIDLVEGKEIYTKARDPELPKEIECCCPDYSIYPTLAKDTACGFLTRGCPRGCGFCHVAAKEGKRTYQVADLKDFYRGQKNIQIMDPNILAWKDRELLLEQIERSGAYVDFNQGLDIRLTSKDIADQIGRMRVKCIHFAWDNPKDDLEPFFQKFTDWYHRKDPSRKMVYVLTNFGSTMEENLHRVYTLRGLGYDPYIMIYNKPNAPKEVRLLQRWCNNKVIFNEVPDFENYDPKKG